MPSNTDRQRFLNEDLVLNVSANIDRGKWDESRYEAFIDELCQDREYQKDAIKTALRYLLGGQYKSLSELAKANYEENPTLEERYGSWEGMERQLQLPDKLAASLDLATATGKSYVLYGIAVILMAKGVVDRVLVLCPSTTIEDGLLEKFRILASNVNLRELLPSDAQIDAPSIVNASQSITKGSICVENYHAVLEHVGSSIRDSLAGKGAHVAVLNDEAHHVANETATKVKKWKEFLLDPKYGFHYVVGVSGTCYVKNDYFADVIYRYSLRQAMDERYVKKVEYISEMPSTNGSEEKWQLIRNRHEEMRSKLKTRNLLPLTIIVTQKIAKCKDVGDELKALLIEEAGITAVEAEEKVLVVYNGAPGVIKLPYVDSPTSKVEWIVSVSMLNEGWDVKRVFQIVPHEQRAFNSKLLIAQVLGRGLRVPIGWTGEHPEVTVFNHDAWATGIRHLVNEILEREKRLPSRVVGASPYHFELLNISYTLNTTSVKKPMVGEYTLFAKGYVDLATDISAEDISIEFERAVTGERYEWRTQVKHKTYTPREVAQDMYLRLEEAQDTENTDPEMRTDYTSKYPVERLEKIVLASLARLNTDEATEGMKQKFLQALGTLRRKTSENVRYTPIADRYITLSTTQRETDKVSASELRNTKAIFYTDATRATLEDEQVFFDEVTEPGSGFKCVRVENLFDFKTPLNLVIADSDNERRFINMLLQPDNLQCYDAWIKSTSTRFYEIDYAWKKGEHPKRGKFSPDFFIKIGDLIFVVEIKGDEELREPSEENRKKNEYSLAHFKLVNQHLREIGSTTEYKFTFLTKRKFVAFFQSLREGKIGQFRSDLDVKLVEDA